MILSWPNITFHHGCGLSIWLMRWRRLENKEDYPNTSYHGNQKHNRWFYPHITVILLCEWMMVDLTLPIVLQSVRARFGSWKSWSRFLLATWSPSFITQSWWAIFRVLDASVHFSGRDWAYQVGCIGVECQQQESCPRREDGGDFRSDQQWATRIRNRRRWKE